MKKVCNVNISLMLQTYFFFDFSYQIMLQIYSTYKNIRIAPVGLFTLLFLLKTPINCNTIVTAIRISRLLLNCASKNRGLIDAPRPINKNKFIILEPVIFPSNKSVSPLLADIIPVTISGSAVPTATIVVPIKLSDHPKLCAIKTLFSTTKSAPYLSPNKPNMV